MTTSAASRPAAVSPSVIATPPVASGSFGAASPRAMTSFTPSVVRPGDDAHVGDSRVRPTSAA